MDNDMMERKVDCDCISQTEAKKEYVVVVAAAAAVDVATGGSELPSFPKAASCTHRAS